MNETITPRLRTDVLVRLFDELEGENRFIVAVDDQHFLVSAAVAAVLEESRNQGTLASVAAGASIRLGVTVSTELASRVLNEQMLSVCFHATEQRADLECPVKLRRRVVAAQALKPLLALLSPLFTPAAAALLIAALVTVEVAVATQAPTALQPALTGTQMVCAAALTLLGIIVHEIGHLTACARFNASHGGIGLGVYWCMPVFYAEVHGAWMLPRLQRAVVDIGGVYLQCGYVLLLGATYIAFSYPPLLEAIVWSHFLMLHTLNPVLKYDGYWLLTDLAGTSNLHAAISQSARAVLNRARGIASADWPSPGALALLTAFSALAAIYFSYVLTLLGHNIGRSAGEAMHRWAIHKATPDGLLHALGETALLALFLVMALSLSVLLARSFCRIGKDSQAC